MKILFFVPYPLQEAPSQRFRFEQYFLSLNKRNIEYKVYPFFNTQAWHMLYSNGNTVKKALYLLIGFHKRFFQVFHTLTVEYVFVHREMTPIGPPILEWVIAKWFKKKIIFDFDDAIWLTDRAEEGSVLSFLKWRRKVNNICSWSYKVSCGNHYLRDHALRFNPASFYNPSTIDSAGRHNPTLYTSIKSGREIVIGWTGSHSTLKYLAALLPVLEQLQNQFSFVSVLVIADQPPNISLEKLTFIKWNLETEIEDLLKIDIGIMPLPDDEWAKGKCGFKALQYMSLEIPAVISPVGVNTYIINHGVNGYLASTEQDWFNYLSALISDEALRNKMGKLGREKVIKNYSVSSNTSNFLSLFE